MRRGRLSHRSLAPGSARHHHPCAFRPRALRLGGLCLPSRHGADPSQAPGRRHDRDGDLRPNPDAQRGRAFVSSRRPCARLGAGSRGLEGRDLGRFGRLQARERRRFARLRADPLSRLHHRVDLRPADLPLAPASRDIRRDRRLAAREHRRRAREHSVRLCARQGAAAASPMSIRRLARSSVTARSRRSTRSIARPESPCRRPVSRREIENKRDFARALDRRAALGRREPVAQALRRLFRCAGERLDAGAGQPPPARPRPRLRAVRPRRLAGPDRGHRGDGRRAHSRDARIHGNADAIPSREGSRRARADDRLRRRRGRGRRRDAPVEARGTGGEA